MLPGTLKYRSAAIAGLAAALLVLGAAGCAPLPASPPTLYQRLGGEAGVSAWVGRTLERAAHDPRTRRSFDGTRLAALQKSIAQQICALAGGGCVYEGETMARSHHDARIAASEFDAMVAILREEIDAQGVDAAAKNELLRLLAPMKRDIVARTEGGA